MEYVLASGSPRRKELLRELVENFTVIPSLADENISITAPEAYVQILAERKAAEVATRPENEGKIVIGADTVVAFNGEILGKPKDEREAYRMLSALSGNVHEVFTGVCFACQKDGERKTFTRAAGTKVRFLTLSPAWIIRYIAGGSPMDKAGAYGIQDGGLVEEIEGSYTNVVGFPVELVQEMLKKVREEWK